MKTHLCNCYERTDLMSGWPGTRKTIPCGSGISGLALSCLIPTATSGNTSLKQNKLFTMRKTKCAPTDYVCEQG